MQYRVLHAVQLQEASQGKALWSQPAALSLLLPDFPQAPHPGAHSNLQRGGGGRRGFIIISSDKLLLFKSDIFAGVNELVQTTTTGFTCSVCGKEFSDKSNCRRHLKEKHFGLNQSQCPCCHQIYLKRYIQGHMLNCKNNH
jgi:hypothetical protein